jgi:hypothetical protein
VPGFAEGGANAPGVKISVASCVLVEVAEEQSKPMEWVEWNTWMVAVAGMQGGANEAGSWVLVALTDRAAELGLPANTTARGQGASLSTSCGGGRDDRGS